MIAYFVNGPCDGQHRVVNTDRRIVTARINGELYHYDLMLGYGDRLIYAWQLSL